MRQRGAALPQPAASRVPGESEAQNRSAGSFSGIKRDRHSDVEVSHPPRSIQGSSAKCEGGANPASVGVVSSDFSDTRVQAYRAGDPAATELHKLWFDGGSRGNGQSNAVARSGALIYRGTTKI